MSVVICPKCGADSPASAVNCPACSVNLQFAMQNPDQIERLKREERLRDQGLPVTDIPKPDTELTTQDAAYVYAAQLLKEGFAASFVATALIQNGVRSELASAIVQDIQRLGADMRKQAGKKNMLYGLGLLGGGVLFTLASFLVSDLCGFVLVARGAVLFGALIFLTGLLQFVFRR